MTDEPDDLVSRYEELLKSLSRDERERLMYGDWIGPDKPEEPKPIRPPRTFKPLLFPYPFPKDE